VYQNGGYTLEHTLKQHDSLVTGIDWAPNTNRIVTCSQDRNAYVFTFQENVWKPELVILRLDRAATCVKWSPNEDKFAVGTGAKAISVCYYEDDHKWWVSKHIRGDKSNISSTINCVAWHPNNILLAAGGTDSTVRVFSTFTKGIDSRNSVSAGTAFGAKLPWSKLLAEFPSASGAWIHDMAFSPSGNQLAWVTHDSSVHFLACSTEAHSVQVVNTPGLPFQTLVWAGENTLVVAGHDCNPAYLQGGAGRYQFKGLLDKGTGAGAQNKSVARTWQARSGLGSTNTADISNDLPTTHQNAVTQLRSFSPTSFSSVGNDGQICIWTYAKLGINVQ